MSRDCKQKATMSNDGFIAVARPTRFEGVGRALQVAYRDGCQLNTDIQAYILRLERVRL